MTRLCLLLLLLELLCMVCKTFEFSFLHLLSSLVTKLPSPFFTEDIVSITIKGITCFSNCDERLNVNLSHLDLDLSYFHGYFYFPFWWFLGLHSFEEKYDQEKMLMPFKDVLDMLHGNKASYTYMHRIQLC